MSGRLILCATPIGNLGDVSPRLVETLGAADVIFAEDTRRARTLLSAIGVDAPLRSYFAGNERERGDELRRRLAHGETVALVTDAGTPSVSDPGVSAVAAARSCGAAVSIVPGPSAVTASVAVSGFEGDRFVFEGFLPRKGRQRKERLRSIRADTRTTVLFLSPHRVLDDLDDLVEVLGGARQVCIVRELTKLHEEVAWHTLAGAVEEWADRQPMGEYTLVVEGAAPSEPDLDAAVEHARRLVADGESRSSAARDAAALFRADRRTIYDAI